MKCFIIFLALFGNPPYNGFTRLFLDTNECIKLIRDNAPTEKDFQNLNKIELSDNIKARAERTAINIVNGKNKEQEH